VYADFPQGFTMVAQDIVGRVPAAAPTRDRGGHHVRWLDVRRHSLATRVKRVARYTSNAFAQVLRREDG
jgi:hypothetical protein